MSKSRSRPSEVVGFLNLKEHQNRNPYLSFILLWLWAIAANTDGFIRAQQAPSALSKPHMKAGIKKSLHSLWKSANLKVERCSAWTHCFEFSFLWSSSLGFSSNSYLSDFGGLVLCCWNACNPHSELLFFLLACRCCFCLEKLEKLNFYTFIHTTTFPQTLQIRRKRPPTWFRWKTPSPADTCSSASRRELPGRPAGWRRGAENPRWCRRSRRLGLELERPKEPRTKDLSSV